jgi:carbon-monoxide dehydrogenase medium subunit
MAEGEVLTAIHVPALPGRFGAAYARLALRNGNGIAVAAVAAGVTLNDDGTIAEARLALGAVAPIPLMAEEAGTLLVGKKPDEAALEAAAAAAEKVSEPICDVRGSDTYRRDVVKVLTRRAVETAAERAANGTEVSR